MNMNIAPKNLAQKILAAHLVEGEMTPGSEIGIKIDQTLTQDATGTMAALQFEALGIPRIRAEQAFSYVDHNMLQAGFENMDDHMFLQSFAAKYGVVFSRPGNGICHQVHLERFALPGKTLLGSDSHTPNAGAMAMIAIGAGGLDVAIANGGGAFFLKNPKIVGVKLAGQLNAWVTGKDVILEILRRISVKGGVGKILEFHGPGVATLSLAQRASITNMGAETGATTSVFPSDERTREYLARQSREADWKELGADPGVAYDEEMEIDLSSLVPLVAQPQSPDNVTEVANLAGLKVQQALVGSCNNSSYEDLMRVAKMLEGKRIHPSVSFALSPGSRQALRAISDNGALATIVAAGGRIQESGCNGCIGMGSSPGSEVVSVRSYNRNFPGRSGTANDTVYLASPEVCVAAALAGEFVDPRELGEYPRIEMPKVFEIDDSGLVFPPADGSGVEIRRGPNIKPLPRRDELPDSLEGEVLLRVTDNISTDTIMPAGAKVLPLRSNIPAIAEYVFAPADPTFAERARAAGGGFVVGGDNYGQGSSREHAALAPMFLGVKAVIVKSFARIHKANLINFGILPLEFADPAGYEEVQTGDHLELTDLHASLGADSGDGGTLTVANTTRGSSFQVKLDVSPRHRRILLAGGLLNFTSKA